MNAPLFLATNTEPTPRDGNVDAPDLAKVSTTLPNCKPVGESVYLPSALLDDVPPEARATTRLLVTLWLVTRGEESTPEQSRWVVNYWHARKRQLNPTRGLATMTTVLFELEWFGDLVASFERVSGGYSVKLKEAA